MSLRVSLGRDRMTGVSGRVESLMPRRVSCPNIRVLEEEDINFQELTVTSNELSIIGSEFENRMAVSGPWTGWAWRRRTSDPLSRSPCWRWR